MKRSKEIPAPIRRGVEARAGGHCEGCGRYAERLELHHRQFLSRGGQHTLANIVALCGWGNHTGCHGKAHGAKPPAGWAIRSWEDPFVELFLRRGVPVTGERLEQLALAA